MLQHEVITILEKLDKPVSVVEADLGMPQSTLAKAKKGERELPPKWDEPLLKYFYDAFPDKIFEGVKEVSKTKLVVEGKQLKEKPSDERMKLIRATNEKINKDFGEGTVMIFGDKPNKDYEVIPTGSLLLDNALGIGGLPRGRMVEIYGAESSGKTTIAMQVIANAQKKGLKCFLVDAENSFDPDYAEALGVITSELGYCQPSYGEQGLEVADRQIMTGGIGVMVIDSVAALVPKAEIEGEMGDNKMGAHARLMSQACRKMVGSIAKTNTLCIFINQIRNKIGVMMGNPEVTTGGMALQFYASIRLSVSRSTTAENSVMNGEGVKEGNKTTVRVIKNKCAPPFRNAVFNIIYGKGVDRLGEVFDLAVENNIIKKSGGWYSTDSGDKLGQGKAGVLELLRSNEDFANEIETKVREILDK